MKISLEFELYFDGIEGCTNAEIIESVREILKTGSECCGDANADNIIIKKIERS